MNGIVGTEALGSVSTSDKILLYQQLNCPFSQQYSPILSYLRTMVILYSLDLSIAHNYIEFEQQDSLSKISLTDNLWTDPNLNPFMVVPRC